MEKKNRCGWVTEDPLYIAYHDTEWGVPVREDARQFEFLILETFQAGLSWLTILRKRENFRSAFDGFDARKVAAYGPEKHEALMQDAGIIRNRAKILAATANAQAFLRVQAEFGTFCNYIYGFVGGQPVVNHFATLSDIPARTALSDRLSADMKARGFKFVGSTVMYAHLQASGIVNDHTLDCFKRQG